MTRRDKFILMIFQGGITKTYRQTSIKSTLIKLASKYMQLLGLSFHDLIGESSLFNRFWIVRSSRTMTIFKVFACRVNRYRKI